MCMLGLCFYGILGKNEYCIKICVQYNVWVFMIEEYDMLYDKEQILLLYNKKWFQIMLSLEGGIFKY